MTIIVDKAKLTLKTPPRGLRTLTLEIRNDSIITSRRLNDVTQIVIITQNPDNSESASYCRHTIDGLVCPLCGHISSWICLFHRAFLELS